MSFFESLFHTVAKGFNFGLLSSAQQVVAKVMLWLGLSFVVTEYVGPEVADFVLSYFDSMPAEALEIVYFLKLDQAIGMIASSIAVRLVTSARLGANGGEAAA